jgi:hypothetical protein
MKRAWTILAAMVFAGCAMENGPTEKPAVDDTKVDATGKAEAWGPADNPFLFGPSLEQRATALPATGEATSIPWAGSYWPVYLDSINYAWDGPGSDSPAKKYEKAFGGSGVEDAVSQYHGIDAQSGRTACTDDSACNSKIGEACAKRAGKTSGYCIPTWWGICHAWGPASILLPEPKQPVTVNGVTFKVNDLKALISLVHDRTNSKFASQRCDLSASAGEVTYDSFGRPTDPACRDTNPGTFHLLLTNYLGIQKASFVYDRTWDAEVWNQPLRGYRINSQREVSATEANGLIGVTTVGGTTVMRSGTVAQGAWAQQGSFPVSAGDAVKVAMTGDGDADLYVRFGSQPDAASYDCRPYTGSSNETCDLTVPAGATTVFVSVNGYGPSSTFNLAITTGGRVPVAYQFNPQAVKFYDVQTDVFYISEADPRTDGPLASVIDQYTGTDSLEYILEVDSAGQIIGGEWVGQSKTHHPDFLWLPTGVAQPSVAGGKILYAQVKALIDQSVAPPGGGGTGGQKTVQQSGTVTQGQWQHFGPFNVAPGGTLQAVMTGTGDADLYVRKSATPAVALYDCRPYTSSSDEQCSVTGPGEVYVSVNGYAASSTFQLQITYPEGDGAGSPPPSPPPTVNHLNVSDSVAQGESKYYTLPVPAGHKIVVRTQAPSDVDLYLQMDAQPTTSSYQMRAWTSSGNETLTITPSSSGVLNILVYGYQASSFTLTTADN